jgi:hypothetical protein
MRWPRRLVPGDGSGRLGGERGAVIVMFAMIIVALLVITALVVDLGMSRQTRRSAALSADFAATAAGWVLAGNGQESVVPNPQAACIAAVDSVLANVNDFPPAGATEMKALCATLPADTAECGVGTTTLQTTTASPYTLLIQYPVDDADIARDEFSTGGTELDGDRCERMKVTIRRADPAIFSRVVGDNGRTMEASAVVRATFDKEGEAVPALLMLERQACGTIQVSGQGGIWVRASNGMPGMIHTDSAAQVPPCGTATNANGMNVYGTSMPSGSGFGGWPSIRADSGDDEPGRIQMYSLAPGVGGRGGAVYLDSCNWVDTMVPGCMGSGLSSPPIGAGLITRRPVDDLYRDNIATLYSSVRARTGWSWDQAQTAGFDVLVSGPLCNASNQAHGTATSRIFVDCASFSGANVVFNGREVVFTGQVSIQNGYVAFPNVRKLYIRGCPSNGGANCAGIDVRSGGLFAVNSGTTQTTAPASWPVQSCLVERPPRDPSQNWTELGLLRGNLAIGNHRLQLCQTMAFLSYDTGSSYQPVLRDSGGNCSVVRPCPADSSSVIVGNTVPRFYSQNSNAIYWTGPNRGTSLPTEYGGDSPFEDLTLWTEAIGTGNDNCSLSGQATLETAGVFFHPNCAFNYGGQTSNAVPFNAQFIGRTLNLSGQAVLSLQPDQEDAIKVPIAGSVYLIR